MVGRSAVGCFNDNALSERPELVGVGGSLVLSDAGISLLCYQVARSTVVSTDDSFYFLRLSLLRPYLFLDNSIFPCIHHGR